MSGTFNDIQDVEPTGGTAVEYLGTSGAVLNADLLPATDVLGFSSFSVGAFGTFTGTISVQASTDLAFTNPITVATNTVSNVTSAPGTTFTGASFPNIWYGAINARYLRVRITGYTSGTAQANITLYTMPAQQLAFGVGGGSVALTASSSTSNGVTSFHKAISAATTNATSVKGSAGRLYWLSLANTTAAAKFFKLYSKATAPTVGTDTPIITLDIQPNTTVYCAINSNGMAIATGIAYAITGAAADADATAVAAGDVIVNMNYL